MNEVQTPPTDLREYFRPIWRRKWIILAILVVAGAASYYFSSRETKKYTASTQIYVQVADPTLQSISSTSQTNNGPSGDQLGDIIHLITSSAVKAGVEEKLGRPVSQAGTVSAAVIQNSDFITITAVSASPKTSARIANLFAEEFLAGRRETFRVSAHQALAAAKVTLQHLPKSSANLTNVAERQNVVAQIQSDEQAILNPQSGASQPTPATVPTVPTSPKPKRDAVFGAALGLLLGIILSFVLEALDSRLSDPADLEVAFGRPILGVLPLVSNPSPSTGTAPTLPNEFIEPLRLVRYQLQLSPSVGLVKTILVTSCMPGEGKTTVTRDLALVYAKAGQRVLLIDGDLRHGALGDRLGIIAAHGLAEVLVQEISLADAVVHIDLDEGADNGSLDVLVGGTFADPSNVLGARRMREFLQQAGEEYDVVLLDTAPLLLVADATPLLPIVDAVLVVARLGRLSKQDAAALTAIIARVGEVNLSGLIVNGVERGRSSYAYGYGYGSNGNSSGAAPAPRVIPAPVVTVPATQQSSSEQPAIQASNDDSRLESRQEVSRPSANGQVEAVEAPVTAPPPSAPAASGTGPNGGQPSARPVTTRSRRRRRWTR